ncbi:LPD28 domain-containing protein [Pseudoflavonifractor sp. 60]|uniref:LPD28 domain-containing protein n=1 Tax=Pseudoflavonifractor sp. 60 TaxID=2304576 RepID=UPI001FAD8AA0|nr:LPD28 domain-containing protein [Pseudoflavonifractor sp. 60]
MLINIYKDKLLGARLFGASVLYSAQPIPQEDVPQGWYCYDLQGTARRPDEPHTLVDRAEENHAGSILSRLPLKNGRSQYRLVKNMFQMTGTNSTLSEFCAAENVHCPEVPLWYQMCPASPEEAGLFYAQTPERDEELGAIGHVRIDFGSGGTGFYHTWWPRGPEESNTQEFRDELDKVVNDLRKGILKDLPSMCRYCCGSEGAIEGGSCCQNYGFTLETERYIYRLRCNPIEGDYQAYISCFVRQEQELGLTELGRQRLKDTADPRFPHSYNWYVMESCSTAYAAFTDGLSLENAIQRYAASENDDKRLGVTKDDIAAVDLVICWEGREWLSHDRLKMEEFKDDPVIAEAADKLQQMLDESQAVGRVTFASGECWNYIDTQKYLQAVREELPFQVQMVAHLPHHITFGMPEGLSFCNFADALK